MKTQKQTEFIRAMNEAGVEVHALAIEKGWWTEAGRNDGELLMLIVSELGELCEGLRAGNPPSEHVPEFTAAEEEAADVIIRLLDMGAARGWRIGEAVVAKHNFNKSRTARHGGKRF